MTRLRLAPAETRIVYLSVAYHLASPRPAAEVAAMQPLATALGTHLDGGDGTRGAEAGITLDLTPMQLHRLGIALYAVVNELKQFEMAQGRSAAPGFSETVRRTFPHVHPDSGGEPGAALDLVGEAMALRRRLDGDIRGAGDEIETARLTAEAEAHAASDRWWKVWRRRR